MPNKKRIRKLFKKKYKISRVIRVYDHFIYGVDFGSGRCKGKTHLWNLELEMMRTMSDLDFRRQYYNDPVPQYPIEKPFPKDSLTKSKSRIPKTKTQYNLF